jgi:hypothetical protein
MQNQATTYPNQNRRPLGRQLCLPISPTSHKTRVPSCSRLLTPPRPPTRLRAQRLLRPNAKLRETAATAKLTSGTSSSLDGRTAHNRAGPQLSCPPVPAMRLADRHPASRYGPKAHLAALCRLRLRALASALQPRGSSRRGSFAHHLALAARFPILAWPQQSGAARTIRGSVRA